jgi:hypothetical protein
MLCRMLCRVPGRAIQPSPASRSKVIFMLRRCAAVLLGLTLLGAGGGCAAGGADRAAASRARRDLNASRDLRPAVSSSESLQVIDDYVARYNKAVAKADGRAWRGLLGDPMAATAAARLRIGHGRPPGRRPITLVNPVLFVPKLDAFPKWFVVAAMQRLGGRGRPHQVLLMFSRSGPAAGWRLANLTVTGVKLPKIATDGQGYAIAVAPDGPAASGARLAVALGDLAGAHAAYLTNATARTFADGPYTTGWRAERTALARRLRGGGWLDNATFGQTRYAPAALRTKDGGVLAWYAISRVESLVAADGHAPDPGTVSADIRDYLAKPLRGSRTEVRAAWLLLPLTYVPARGRPAVLGLTTALTSAAAIEH